MCIPTSSSYLEYRHRYGEGDGGLRAGPATIWVCMLSKGSNIDYFTMSNAAGGGAYGGVPATVPGTIEDENFDKGRGGVAYSDFIDGNAGKQFRPDEDVDIQKVNGGGFSIGWITAGEYLRYTVDVTEDGT
ncbi:unnamed protein product, partial [Laminaria digitata]